MAWGKAMISDIDEANDWLGAPVSCEPCAHRHLAADGFCQLKHACVHDRTARRIDRFFDLNPELANGYLAHPYFEVRVIATRWADVFRLPALLDDPDETVRWSAAKRLPRRYLLNLRNDPHREVRIRIASLLDPADLAPMKSDDDYYVRLAVARRIPASELTSMTGDQDPEVRRVVASRIDHDALWRMLDDGDARVRLVIAQRLTPVELIGFRNDPDWRVRHEAASRMVPGMLAAMIDDPDDAVRERVLQRMTTRNAAEFGGNVVAFKARAKSERTREGASI
jgi:hypothetical protein